MHSALIGRLHVARSRSRPLRASPLFVQRCAVAEPWLGWARKLRIEEKRAQGGAKAQPTDAPADLKGETRSRSRWPKKL